MQDPVRIPYSQGVVRKLFWIAAFGIAFGLVEAAVVVYLRFIGHPGGFEFANGMLPDEILSTEIMREGATIVILLATSILAGKTALSKFGVFLTVFGVWDLFYYIWLKIFLGWPQSFMDADILFLIPGTWAGPVLAPMMVSAALAGCGSWMVWREETGRPVRTGVLDWIVESAAAVVIISSFFITGIVPGADPGSGYTLSFPWWLFLSGFSGGLGYFLWRVFRR